MKQNPKPTRYIKNGKYVIDEPTKARAKKNQDLRKPKTTGETGMGEMFNVPQNLVTKSITGRYEGPGDALYRKGHVTETGRGAVNFVADPLNALPFAKMGKFSKLSDKSVIRKTAYNKVNRAVQRTSNFENVKQEVKSSKKKK
jgi:hypothetical protein